MGGGGQPQVIYYVPKPAEAPKPLPPTSSEAPSLEGKKTAAPSVNSGTATSNAKRRKSSSSVLGSLLDSNQESILGN